MDKKIVNFKVAIIVCILIGIGLGIGFRLSKDKNVMPTVTGYSSEQQIEDELKSIQQIKKDDIETYDKFLNSKEGEEYQKNLIEKMSKSFSNGE